MNNSKITQQMSSKSLNIIFICIWDHIFSIKTFVQFFLSETQNFDSVWTNKKIAAVPQLYKRASWLSWLSPLYIFLLLSDSLGGYQKGQKCKFTKGELPTCIVDHDYGEPLQNILCHHLLHNTTEYDLVLIDLKRLELWNNLCIDCLCSQFIEKVNCHKT